MIDLDGLPKRLTEAAHRIFSREEGNHPVPSPSGAYDCVRKQWYKGRGYPVTNPPPVRSMKKMSQGKAIEPWWRAIYDEIPELTVIQPAERLPIGVSTGEVDGLLTDGTFTCVLELKDLGQWSYQDALLKGVKEGHPEYYLQVQLYMKAAFDAGIINDKRVVFHAGMADASGFLWYWRRIKKKEWTNDLDFYTEIIEYDEVAVQWGLDRMQYVESIKKSEDVPPRNFNPEAGQFPCGSDEQPYCPMRDTCLADGGVTVDREAPF